MVIEQKKVYKDFFCVLAFLDNKMQDFLTHLSFYYILSRESHRIQGVSKIGSLKENEKKT